MSLLPIKDNENFRKDEKNNAIINTNKSEYKNYIEKRKKLSSERERINSLENKVDDLSNDISEIKNLLKSILEHK